MRHVAVLLLVLDVGCCKAQTPISVVSPSQLQAVNGLPTIEAVKARKAYKAPLKIAYARQMKLTGKDCQSVQGQQPYNICLGQASVTAEDDFAVFYNNLQMLCHDQEQLTALQTSRGSWLAYSKAAMKAASATWPDGTGAPGFAGQVYLSLVRDYMRELNEIYTLNIAQ